MAKTQRNKLREDEGQAAAELREKVKSKMEVAKFFAGFITLLVAFVLKDGLDTALSKLGIVLLTASLGFCIASVFAYDRLLMPREYWTVLSSDEGSAINFQNQLQEQMVRSWRWLFVPAIWCFGIGFLLVFANALQLKVTDAGHLSWGVLLILAMALPRWLFKVKGPKIDD